MRNDATKASVPNATTAPMEPAVAPTRGCDTDVMNLLRCLSFDTFVKKKCRACVRRCRETLSFEKVTVLPVSLAKDGTFVLVLNNSNA